MRRFLPLFLILLLVLRGLLSPSAAVAMGPALPAAPSAAVAMQHAQPPAQHSGETDGFALAASSPCHSAAPTSASQADSCSAGGSAVDDACTTCTQCDICHSALLLPPAPRSPGAPLASVLPARTATAFASAPAALAIKPPIS